jgi:hypothetical protein
MKAISEESDHDLAVVDVGREGRLDTIGRGQSYADEEKGLPMRLGRDESFQASPQNTRGISPYITGKRR